MSLSPEIKQRVLAAARSEPSPARPAVQRRTLAMVLVAVGVAAGVFLAAGGVRRAERPLELMLLTSAGTAAIAALAIWSGLWRGPSMLGRRRSVLLAVGLAAPAMLLAWRSGVSSLFEGMTRGWPARLGFRCLGLTLAVSLAPLLIALFARRRSNPLHPASEGAAVGVAVGLGAAFTVDLWCPVAHPQHVLLGHVAPVAALALAGAVLGARWLSIRARR
jgi:hypothetical protein